MDKALDMGKSSATGSFHMLIGVVVSTVIMAVGTILITRFMPSSTDYGLYGAALLPSSIINFFRDWGVNSAMTKQIAHLRTNDQKAEIHDVIVSGVIFEIISGAVLSAICFVLADVLAAVLNSPESSTLIALMSPSIFLGAVLAAASAVFVGFERMKLNSLTTICQAVVKTVAGPALVLLGFGVFGAVVSAMVAVAAGGIIGIVIVYFVLFRPLRQAKTGRSEFSRVLKPMLKYGLPLTVSNIVIGVLPLLFGSLMLIYAGESFYGNYMAALNFAVLVTFFTIPISTVLFPTFSKFNPKDEPGLIKTVFASSVKYTSVLVVPATMAIMVLSSAAVNTLYGYTATGDPKYVFTPFFLILSVLVNLFCLAGNISMGTFLTGIGETKLLMKQGLLTLAVGLPLALGIVVYLPTFVGGEIIVTVAIAGIFFSGVPSTVWGLYWVWKHFGAKADFRVSAKIFGACLVASLVTFLLLYVIGAMADWLKLIVGLIVFLVLYLIAAPLVGAVNQTDVNNFRTMFSGLGIVSKLLEIPLKIVEVPLRLRHRKT